MEKIAAFRKIAANLFFNKVLYLEDESRIIYKDGRIERVDAGYDEKTRVVVIGKSLYFEAEKTFPFSSLKDIRSAIKTDITSFSPFETDIFIVRKISDTGERSRVNLWFIDKKIIKTLQALKPLLIIPETALLSFLNGDESRIYTIKKSDTENLLVYIGRDRSVKSITSLRGNPDIKHFQRSVGGDARDCQVKDFSKIEEYFGLFQAAFNAVPVNSIVAFRSYDFFTDNLKKNYIGKGLATAAVLFFIYMGLSVLMPYYAEKKLLGEDKELSQKLSGLLEKQEMVEIFHNRQKALAEKIDSYTFKIPLLNLLNTVLPEKVTIRRFTVSGNLVEMRGTAPKATLLLSALAQDNRVKNAQFTSPIREDKKTGMEVFVLTFIYAE